MNAKYFFIASLALLTAIPVVADDDDDKVDLTPKVHGTIRGKYEYQTEEGDGRFQVRNARVSLEGNVTKIVSYKAEIDLSDEGQIKMLDAYTRLKPVRGLDFTIGQMRVPFTIDAHRSPHMQYFANRSDMAGGSTLGNLAMAQMSMKAVACPATSCAWSVNLTRSLKVRSLSPSPPRRLGALNRMPARASKGEAAPSLVNRSAWINV